MTVQNLIEKLNLEIISEGENLNAQICGCFASDLLSLAMANVQKDNVWITVQTNMNILGIAALAESACVIIAQGLNIPKAVVEKAKEENICVLRSNSPVYELCVEIGKLI